MDTAAATVEYRLEFSDAPGEFKLFATSNDAGHAGLAAYGVSLTGPITSLNHVSPSTTLAENIGQESGSAGFTLLRSPDGSALVHGSQDTITATPHILYGLGQQAGSLAEAGLNPLSEVEGGSWESDLLLATGTFDASLGTVGIDYSSATTLANVFKTRGSMETMAAAIPYDSRFASSPPPQPPVEPTVPPPVTPPPPDAHGPGEIVVVVPPDEPASGGGKGEPTERQEPWIIVVGDPPGTESDVPDGESGAATGIGEIVGWVPNDTASIMPTFYARWHLTNGFVDGGAWTWGNIDISLVGGLMWDGDAQLFGEPVRVAVLDSSITTPAFATQAEAIIALRGASLNSNFFAEDGLGAGLFVGTSGGPADAPIPEPSAAALLGASLLGLFAIRRRTGGWSARRCQPIS